MAATFEITDGTNTIDLIKGDYAADINVGIFQPSPPGNPIFAGNTLRTVNYSPRSIRLPLVIRGDTVAKLKANIRSVQRMLSRARRRQELDSATKVTLKYQMESTNADDLELTVLYGTYDPPNDLLLQLEPAERFYAVRGTLTLTLIPLGEFSTDVTMQIETLQNEQDGDQLNYMDIGNQFGAYLSFDGVDDVVNVPDIGAIQDVFDGGGTFEARIYPNSDGETNEGRIVSKRNAPTSGWTIFTEAESGGFVNIALFYEFTTTDGRWNMSSANVPIGEWSHLAVTYDNGSGITVGGTPTFYLNGVAQTTNVVTAPAGTRQSDVGDALRIGNNNGTGATFDGRIDDVRLWDDTRTGGASGEIASNYNAEIDPTSANLVGYWKFDDSGGTEAHDSSATGRHGTISGATWGVDDPLGDAGGLLQIRIDDPSTTWTGNKRIWAALNSGERRTHTLFLQSPDSITSVTSPFASGGSFTSSTTGGDFSTNASAGNSAEADWSVGGSIAVNTGFQNTAYMQYDIAAANIPEGLFRVLVRGAVHFDFGDADAVETDLGFALGYNFGATTKTPVAADHVAYPVNTANEWNIVDVGELSIPPVATPDGFTNATFSLRIHTTTNLPSGTSVISTTTERIEWYIDCIYLLPIHDGVVVVADVDNADRVLIDMISNTPGVYQLNSSNVVQGVFDFNGAPFMLGVEPARLYVIRDDTGDPSAVSFDVTVKYTPLVLGV